jgi:hypothetical protein
MAVDLDDTALVRWRASPIAFIEEMLHDPETGRPFVLLEAERAFMRHAFTLDRNGRLAYPELVYGAIKKSGKTTCAALIVLVMVLLLSDVALPRATALPTTLSRRNRASSRLSGVLSRRHRCCDMGPSSLPTALLSQRLMPASLRLRPTRQSDDLLFRRALRVQQRALAAFVG